MTTRSWAGQVTSRSVSGTPGRTTRARSLFAPCIDVGWVSTSHSNPSAVKQSPTWRSIGKTDAESASGFLGARGRDWGLLPLRCLALHSMTRSARSSSDCGTMRPMAFAVFRLMINSNLVGSWTGKSAGLAPLSIWSM